MAFSVSVIERSLGYGINLLVYSMGTCHRMDLRPDLAPSDCHLHPIAKQELK